MFYDNMHWNFHLQNKEHHIFYILYLQTEFGGFSRLYYNILAYKLAGEDSSMWIVEHKPEF